MGALLQKHLSYPIKTLLSDQLRDYQIHCCDYDLQEEVLSRMEERTLDLTKYEMETIYNYNQEDPLASCYTMDRALIRRLNVLAEKHKEITLLRSGEGMREYTFPKKWIKVRAPKELSEEQRENMAKRARERFGFAKEGDNSEQE